MFGNDYEWVEAGYGIRPFGQPSVKAGGTIRITTFLCPDCPATHLQLTLTPDGYDNPQVDIQVYLDEHGAELLARLLNVPRPLPESNTTRGLN